MNATLLGLVALACPIGMVLMMLLMGRGMMGGRARDASSATTSPGRRDDDLDALRAERERLDGQIGALEAERR